MAQSNRHTNCRSLTVTANPVPSSHDPLSASGLPEKLTAGFYVLLTFLPYRETSLGGGFWGFVWQLGLLCPVFWWVSIVQRQRQMPRLGWGWDLIAVWTSVALIASTVFAGSPDRSLLSVIAAGGYMAVVYALKSDLQRPQQRYQVLLWQGYVNFGVILWSLALWAIQAVFPAWQRWRELRTLDGSVELSILPNAMPLGNPDAVAAYLMLALPLLLGLAIGERGGRRGLWVCAVVLGLMDLYTTDSAVGWLGLGVLGIWGFALIGVPKLGAKGLVLVALAVAILFAAARIVVSEDVTGRVTTTAGWQMVREHLWTGVGLGGIPWLYPQYHPFWGGRAVGWMGQFPSTVLQVLAQLGILGTIAVVAAIFLLGYQGIRWWVRYQPLQVLFWMGEHSSETDKVVWFESLLPLCLYGGLMAYGIVSLFEYSWNCPAIAGTLAIYLAVLLSRERIPPVMRVSIFIPIVLWGILGAAIVWLTPVYRAAYLAGQGVAGLKSLPPDVASFVRNLTGAYQLVPWKPEYPLQLGWVSGSLHWQDAKVPKVTIDWMQRGIAASPHQVFGYSRLGWLLLQNDPGLAAKAFGHSIQLIPAQRGVFYGLGRALLANGQMELAIEAFALEVLRNPAFLTRPLWTQPDLEPLLGRVSDRLEQKYTILLKNDSLSSSLQTALHQNRGGLRWWMGHYKQAREDWQEYGSDLSKLVLQLASLESSESVKTELRLLPPSAAKWAIEAWLYPERRRQRLQDAWKFSHPEALAGDIVQTSLATMNAAPNFDEWIKQTSPKEETPLFDQDWTPWGQDFSGLTLPDFPQLGENLVLTDFFGDELWQSPDVFPELDHVLQLWREALLNSALQRE